MTGVKQRTAVFASWAGIAAALLFCVALAGCQTTPGAAPEMSVDEARQVALKFQGKYDIAPPRGFGDFVQLLVDRHETLDPATLEKCSKPGKSFTEEEIAPMANAGGHGVQLLSSLAWEYFYNGAAQTAERFADVAVRTAPPKNSHRAIALSTHAFMLAAQGKLPRARRALSQAYGYGREYMATGWRGKTDAWGYWVGFNLRLAEGGVRYGEGNFTAAETSFYRALDNFEQLNETSSTMFFGDWRIADAKVWLAKTMMMQERLQEAEIWAREAPMENHPHVRPHALLILSQIFYGRERFEESRRLALTARNMVIDRCIAADALVRAQTRESLARALMAQGRWQEALEEFETIRKEMRTDPETFNRRFGASADWGITLLASNRLDDALSFLDRALAASRVNYGAGHFNTLELKALKGAATAERGDAADAMALFDEVMPPLVDRWSAGGRDTAQQTLRKQRALWILEAYIHLAGASGDQGKIDEAFAVVAQIQSKKVGRSLSGSMARAKVSDPDLAALIRQRQDLEMQLRYFESRLSESADSPEGLSSGASKESLLAEIGELNAAMDALDEEVRARFPRYADVVDPLPMAPAEAQTFMKPDEALILVFVGHQRSFVWAFRSTGPVAFSEVAAGETALADLAARLRKAVDPERVDTLEELPSYDVGLGHRLYRMLLDPVRAGWQPANNLVVIAPYPLDQIPFAMLPTQESPAGPDAGLPFSGYRQVPWLVRSHAVAVLPSVSSLRTLRTLASDERGRPTFAGFGDPLFSADQTDWQNKAPSSLASRGGIHRRGIRVAASGSLDDEELSTVDISMLQPLPDTAMEVTAIAEVLGADKKTDVFLGQNASEGRIKTLDLDTRRILVFATHGLVPGDLDGLHQPALALSNPAVTGEPGDGLLTMGEVMELSLNADWVVLSACNTAAAEGAGAEALSGLGQAFFYAGARTLLLTSWPVETTSARLLTTELFRQQMMDPAAPRAVVLQRTMNRLIGDMEQELFSYAHPIFWAPFVLVGDGS